MCWKGDIHLNIKAFRMPIKFKFDLEWYQPLYLKTDPEQSPFLLIGIAISPNGPIFTLVNQGEEISCYEGEFTTEIDDTLKLGIQS